MFKLTLSAKDVEFIESQPSLPDLINTVITDHSTDLEINSFRKQYSLRLIQLASLVDSIEGKIDSDLDYHHLLNLLVLINNTKNILKCIKLMRARQVYKNEVNTTDSESNWGIDISKY